MPRKTAYLTIKVVVESDSDIDMDSVVSDLDYEITSTTDGTQVVYTEITDRDRDD